MKKGIKEQKGIEYYMQLPYSILLHQIEDQGKSYWMAEFPELPGCTSHGSTIDEAVQSVEEAKKDWILDSLEEGEQVPVPIDRDRFSGKTLVRMSRSLHRALALLAESERLSLNQLIVTILAKEVGRLGVLNRVEEKLDELLDKVNDVIERDELMMSWGGNVLYLGSEPQRQSQSQVRVGDISLVTHEATDVLMTGDLYNRTLVGTAAVVASPYWPFGRQVQIPDHSVFVDQREDALEHQPVAKLE